MWTIWSEGSNLYLKSHIFNICTLYYLLSSCKLRGCSSWAELLLRFASITFCFKAIYNHTNVTKGIDNLNGRTWWGWPLNWLEVQSLTALALGSCRYSVTHVVGPFTRHREAVGIELLVIGRSPKMVPNNTIRPIAGSCFTCKSLT